MKSLFEYILLFIAVMLLQVLLINNIEVSVVVHPFVYVVFVILLPLDLMKTWVLLLAFMSGVVMDLLSGVEGIYAAAATFMGFCRPAAAFLMIGKQEVADGVIPVSSKIGTSAFLKYSALMVLLHNIVFFTLERLTTAHLWLTLLQIVGSVVTSLVLIWICQMVFTGRKSNF